MSAAGGAAANSPLSSFRLHFVAKTSSRPDLDEREREVSFVVVAFAGHLSHPLSPSASFLSHSYIIILSGSRHHLLSFATKRDTQLWEHRFAD